MGHLTMQPVSGSVITHVCRLKADMGHRQLGGFRCGPPAGSRALNYSGTEIPKSARSIDPGGFWHNLASPAYKGIRGDDKWYIIRAVTMNKYLTANWGKPDYTIQTNADYWTVMSHLNNEQQQIAIFARKSLNGAYGHSGVLKQGYEDPYLPTELPVDVWMLP